MKKSFLEEVFVLFLFLFFLFLKNSYAATPMYVSSRRYSATHERITIHEEEH